MAFTFSGIPQDTLVLSTVGMMLLLGFVGSRFTKLLRLPSVTAYILVGVVFGPELVGLFPAQVLSHMDFLTDIALSFIAFGVGRYFKISVLRENGKSVFVITLFESLSAAAIVMFVMHSVFSFSLTFSCIMGAIASSTAPASTIMTIRQTNAKGPFVQTLLQVVALDDLVALVAFSVAVAVGQLSDGEDINTWQIIVPVATNIISIFLGGCLGLFVSWVFSIKKKHDNRLVILLACFFLNAAICDVLSVSPLLSCMMLGMAYVNHSGDESVFDQVADFSVPFLLLFFVLAGSKLSISSLSNLGGVGVVYFVIRIVGKYAGASIGGLVTRSDSRVTRYLGLGLIPQAGVSIGLAALGARSLSPQMGAMLNTIIISSSVLYEMVGPACAKLSLSLSGSYVQEAKEKKLPQDKNMVVGTSPPASSFYCDSKTSLGDRNDRLIRKNSVQFRIYEHRST
jgi:Kef-type K+ transport system membrane component KefB